MAVVVVLVAAIAQAFTHGAERFWIVAVAVSVGLVLRFRMEGAVRRGRRKLE